MTILFVLRKEMSIHKYTLAIYKRSKISKCARSSTGTIRIRGSHKKDLSVYPTFEQNLDKNSEIFLMTLATSMCVLAVETIEEDKKYHVSITSPNCYTILLSPKKISRYFTHFWSWGKVIEVPSGQLSASWVHFRKFLFFIYIGVFQ